MVDEYGNRVDVPPQCPSVPRKPAPETKAKRATRDPPSKKKARPVAAEADDELMLSMTQLLALLRHGADKQFKATCAADGVLTEAALDAVLDSTLADPSPGPAAAPDAVSEAAAPDKLRVAGERTIFDLAEESIRAAQAAPKPVAARGKGRPAVRPVAAESSSGDEDDEEAPKTPPVDVDAEIDEALGRGARRVRVAPKRYSPVDLQKASKRPKLSHEDDCFVCDDGGELIECGLCPKVPASTALHHPLGGRVLNSGGGGPQSPPKLGGGGSGEGLI